MVKKILISLGIVFVSFLTGYATAQSYFNFSTPQPAMSSQPAQNKTVMSPSEFQNQTKQLQQQKNEGLSNKLKENLSTMQPPLLPPQPAAPESGMGSATPGQKGPSQAGHPMTGAAPGSTTTTPAQAPQNQTNVYTGFQGQGQGQGQGQNKNQPPPSSGGWNIQY